MGTDVGVVKVTRCELVGARWPPSLMRNHLQKQTSLLLQLRIGLEERWPLLPEEHQVCLGCDCEGGGGLSSVLHVHSSLVSKIHPPDFSRRMRL